MKFPAKEELTFALALLGSVTGVMGILLSFLNTWRAFDRDRVRLKVSVRWAFLSFPIEDTRELLCVDVINVGFVPVTVSQIGFDLAWPSKRWLAFLPLKEIGDPLPHRLEPRTSMIIYVPRRIFDSSDFAPVTNAFAKTACGRLFRAKSPALKQQVTLLRKANPDWRKNFSTKTRKENS